MANRVQFPAEYTWCIAHEPSDRSTAVTIPNCAARWPLRCPGETVSPRPTTPDYLREARLVAGVDHPGIVPVHDLGRTDEGRCYVVSKYVAGDNLATNLARASRWRGGWELRLSAIIMQRAG